MDYMFLIYHDTEGYKYVTQELIAEAMKDHRAIQDEAKSKGVFNAAGGLGMPQAAKSIHLSDGNLTMTDGPFAETKEALGGFYVIDCKDDDEAQYWATKLAYAGRQCTIEYRKIDHRGGDAQEKTSANSKAS